MEVSPARKGGNQVGRKGLFGYEPPPDQRTPHRDVLKWVQSLDLSHSLKNVRRDTANGFMVAEILSRYFPHDVQMHSFENATCSRYKKDNWEQVKKLLYRQDIELPDELILRTLEGEYGAGVDMLETLYEILNRKKLPQPEELPDSAQNFVPDPALQFNTSAADPEDHARSGAARVSRDVSDNQAVEFGDINIKEVHNAASLRQNLSKDT